MENATGHDRIRISESTLKWLGSEYESCFLTLVADEPSALGELAAAVLDAAQATRDRTPDAEPITVPVVLDGLDAVHLRVDYGGLTPKEQVRRWAQSLAEDLADAGVGGTLRRPRAHYPPSPVLQAFQSASAMTVFCAGRRPKDVSIVTRLATFVELERFGAHDVRAPGLWVRTPYEPDHCSTIARLDEAFTVSGWSEGPVAQASIGFLGARAWDARSSRGDWTEQASRARAGLVSLAPDLDHAWAEKVNGFQDWGGGPRHHPEGITAGIYRQHEVLWPSKVVDVHGLQVLTSEHLDRISSLTDWRTEQVGDRYLVEARDLGPWFVADEPDADVLSRGRADFAAVIATQRDLDSVRAAEQQARS